MMSQMSQAHDVSQLMMSQASKKNPRASKSKTTKSKHKKRDKKAKSIFNEVTIDEESTNKENEMSDWENDLDPALFLPYSCSTQNKRPNDFEVPVNLKKQKL